MTVADLITILAQYPSDMKVLVQQLDPMEGCDSRLCDPNVQTDPVNIRRWSWGDEYVQATHPTTRDAMAVVIY